VQICDTNQFENIYFSFGNEFRKYTAMTTFPYISEFDTLFGQKFFIRLGVTPRGCKCDQVNILYVFWFLILNEIICWALQPVFLKDNINELCILKKDKYC